MVGLLFFLGIIGLVVYLFTRNSAADRQVSAQMQLEQRNYEWAQFIANYYSLVHGKAQKELIRRMLDDIANKGLAVPAIPGANDLQNGSPQVDAPVVASQVAPVPTAAQPALSAGSVPRQSPQVDNTSLLLYFGAFLFVASAGLFVAFGGLPGSARTVIVLLVSLALYGSGTWLFRRKPRLKQAALAFAGIGMAIAPLTGVAAYSYLFDNSNGPAVWFATSMLCLALYVHALKTLRTTLMGYILICTFVSLVESGVSIISAPIYYYGWALALAGLGIGFLSMRIKTLGIVAQPAMNSAQVFIPLALGASLLLVGEQGTGQLGVSLLISAAYYCLQSIQSKDTLRMQYAVASQLSGIAGVVAIVYSLFGSVSAISIAIIVLTFVQLAVLVTRSPSSELWRSCASVTLVAQVIGVLLPTGTAVLTVFSLLGLIVAGIVLWLRQSRVDAYAVAMAAWMVLPMVFGLLVLHPQLRASWIAVLTLASLSLQFGLYLLRFSGKHEKIAEPGRQVYLLSAAGVALISLWASGWWCFAICASIAASMLYAAYIERLPEWPQVGGLIVALPIALAFFDYDSHRAVLLVTTLSALAYNIGSALWFREESNRWYIAVLALLLPLTAGGALGPWQQPYYAWAYLGVAILLIGARAVARGALFPSSTIPLASFARSASVSYSTGYTAALVISLLLAFTAENSRLHGSIIAALQTVAVIAIGHYVEKRADIYTLVPVLVQLVAWSVLRPANNSHDMNVFLLVSIGLAIVAYAVPYLTSRRSYVAASSSQAMVSSIGSKLFGGHWLQDGAVIAATVAPASVLFVGKTYWPMAFGLLLFSAMLFDKARRSTQENRELSGGVALLAVYWYMWFMGVHEIQAYAHVLIALFAAYAYWRHRRGDHDRSDQYLVAMLLTATIPLTFQAITGVAGGLYGWWLLLEQVAFMLIGMSIRKHFVTMWGLYVAVAAVLYQLRHLGWAALTVLALFLIGLAVYRLQKNPKV